MVYVVSTDSPEKQLAEYVGDLPGSVYGIGQLEDFIPPGPGTTLSPSSGRGLAHDHRFCPQSTDLKHRLRYSAGGDSQFRARKGSTPRHSGRGFGASLQSGHRDRLRIAQLRLLFH